MSKKTKKKNKKTLNRLLGKKFCPHCGEPFEDEGIGYSEHGEQTFHVTVKKGMLHYEDNEWYPSDESEFYCGACGENLDLSEDEIINILK